MTFWGKTFKMVHLSRSHCRCQDNTLDGPLICFIVKFEYFEFTGWEQIQNSQYDTYMYDHTSQNITVIASTYTLRRHKCNPPIIALLTSIGQSLQYPFFLLVKK